MRNVNKIVARKVEGYLEGRCVDGVILILILKKSARGIDSAVSEC
jgi:hypothetical protein